MSGRGSEAPTPGERLFVVGYLLLLGSALLWVAASKALWYDELFTWHVATQDGPGGVLRALLAGADNGPPVDYWCRQASLALFGESPLAFRLPSVLGYVLALYLSWSFARCRLSRLASWAVLLVPSGTVCLYYATEARGYAALLLLMSLSLFAWQRALESPGRRRWPLLLFLALAVSPLTHYYGVLGYLPVAGGELWRVLRGGGFRRGIAVGIGASSLALLLLPPFARNALEMREAFWASSYGLATPLHSYRYLLGEILLPLLSLLFLGVLFSLAAARGRRATSGGFEGHERAAIVVLVLLPFVVLLLAAVATNAMTHRYALASCLGFALLAATSVGTVERRFPRAARLLLLTLFLWTGLQVAYAGVRAGLDATNAELALLLESMEAPVVADSPQRFLRCHHGLSEPLRAKWFYLYDRERSREYLGYDNDEIAMANLKSWAAVQTEPFADFVAREREFTLVASRHRGWLLTHLREAGADLRSVFRSEELEIYRVKLRG